MSRRAERGTIQGSPEGWKDAILAAMLRFGALTSGSIVVLIAALLLLEAFPALAAVGSGFLTDTSWHPAPEAANGTFGILPMVAGTLAVTFGAISLAAPLGLLSAIACRDYAPGWLRGLYKGSIELMAGVPSVVYGLWGMTVLAPLILQWRAPGVSLLAGIIVLAMMVLPTVVLLSESALARVPAEYTRAAAALGMNRSRILWGVTIPAARSGIVTGVILAIGRALSETMAVLMVTGNVVQYPNSLFDPMRALTSNIALEMAYAMDDHWAALFVSGLLLTAMVALLTGAAEVMSRGRIHA